MSQVKHIYKVTIIIINSIKCWILSDIQHDSITKKVRFVKSFCKFKEITINKLLEELK